MNVKRNTITWDWKKNFTLTLLEQGEKDVREGKLRFFDSGKDNDWATCITAGGFHCQVIAPASYRECREYGQWRTGTGTRSQRSYYWNDFDDPEDLPDDRFSCNCSTGINKRMCRHVASLMVRWEQKHGPFTFTETEEEARFYREEEKRLDELRRLEQERKKKEKTILMVPDVIKDTVQSIPSDVYFRLDQIAEGVTTNQYEVDLAASLSANSSNPSSMDASTADSIEPPSMDSSSAISHEPSSADAPSSIEAPSVTDPACASAPPALRRSLPSVEFSVSYAPKGEQVLQAEGRVDDEYVCLEMTRKAFTQIRCSCCRSENKSTEYAWNKHPARLCCHALLVFEAAWEKNLLEKPGDETDLKAAELLAALADGIAAEVPADTEEETDRAKTIFLNPKITRDKKSDALQLSFMIGKSGERFYTLRSLDKLVAAESRKGVYELSKKSSIDFSAQDFADDSRKWFDFIATRVRNLDSLNRRLEHVFFYVPQLSAGSGIPLEGNDLDRIYDLAKGTEIPVETSYSRTDCVKVGPGIVRADITLTPKPDHRKKPLYIEMKGTIPRLLQGSQYQYVLDSTQFGRVTGEKLEILNPYRAIANSDGVFLCRIGLKKFPEFYYRVLPMLRSADAICLHDNTTSLNLDFLPPEPEFTFYIDMDEVQITCRPEVTYADHTCVTGYPSGDPSVLRDMDQENRVEDAVMKYFNVKSSSGQVYFSIQTEEMLITVLTEAVPLLSQYGEVKGSDAFHSVHIYPAPQPRFSVEIEGGLLELSIRTKDLTADELIGILDSYHEKKRWYRLKNGDYIDVRKAPALQSLESLAESLDISMEEMIKGQVQVPAYRSLYVDRLLEEHDAVAVARDRHFKSLVRSFRTIQDSDFEVDESLTDVLRPYQLHGFRWLSTLSQAGFGGILADEMGLGKTIQMLSYLLFAKQAGETKPALIICPSSLVYNWKEECQHFTGALVLDVLAGSAKSRKDQLKQISSGECADVYVTSYDLLKRDITHFENILFSTIVLDEAQFIKNQKAAVTKAVKVLKAEHRFALTGTPIENRLSELWSIFDFLMPGFLYSAKEFGQRFEGPIMKKKDAAATRKLSRMTSPFILRRRKMDVLKDLPEKLEEVQSFAMEEDQRRLYDAQVVRMRQMLESFAGTGEDKLRVLAQITKLRQVCCDPSLLFEDYHGSSTKRAACLDLVERAIDSGHRMLIFSQFTSMLDLLANDLKKAQIDFYTITGSTPKQERLRLVNDFNNGDTPVFLISLRAGGTGLNLVGADVVIHYDPWWNLAVQNQATDRAHRIGQTRQVTVVKMIAMDTIEEKIILLQEAKREMADAIMNGEGTSLASLSKEELLELVQ